MLTFAKRLGQTSGDVCRITDGMNRAILLSHYGESAVVSWAGTDVANEKRKERKVEEVPGFQSSYGIISDLSHYFGALSRRPTYYEREGAFDRKRCDGMRHPLTHVAGVAHCWHTSGALWVPRHIKHPEHPDQPAFLWLNIGSTHPHVTEEERGIVIEIYHTLKNEGWFLKEALR